MVILPCYNTHYTMTQKSPFEIRADLLKLSQDHLEKQYEANLEFMGKAYFKMLEQGQITQENMQQFMPKFPDTTEILAKAKEFYAFVNTQK